MVARGPIALAAGLALGLFLVLREPTREPARESGEAPGATEATPDVEVLPFLSEIDLLELHAFPRTASAAGRSPVELEEREELAPPAEGATRLLRGIVFEGEAGPASAGQVEVLVDSRSGSPSTAELLDLGPDGRFEVRVPLDVHVRLRAELPHGPVGQRRVISYAAESPLDVALHAYPRGSLSGRLVDLRGRGLTGFRVEARQDSEARHPDELREIRPSAVAAHDGSFTVQDLRLAPTSLFARGPRGTAQRDWPLDEGLDPSMATNEKYTLPLVQLTVVALDDRNRMLPVHATLGNWAPSGMSMLSFESLGDGWIGLPERMRVSGPAMGPRQGLPVFLTAEVGHDYRLMLTGWNHAVLVEDLRDVQPSDAHENIRVTLRPAMTETRVSVEFAMEDPRGIVGEQFSWNLMGLRKGAYHQVSIADPSSPVTRLELPPGSYSLGVRFLASESAKGDPEGHGADTLPELRDGFWSVSDTIEVREPADAPGVQRFVLRSEHARPPLPPGLVGPGDY